MGRSQPAQMRVHYASRALARGAAAAAVAAIAAVWAPVPAHAAGIESPELGAVSVGRGGAVAACPTDGLALQFNPAGLGHSRGVQLQVDGKLAWHRVGFTAALPELAAAGESRNQHGLYATPTNAALTWSFGRVGPLPNLTLGIGAFGPSATGKLSYDPAGAQRYDKIAVDYFLAYYTLGAGVRFHPSWSVGASLQLGQGTASFSQATRPFPGPLAQNNDVVASLDVSSKLLVTGVAGVTYTPNPYWAIGLSYRPQVSFHGQGTLKAQIPAALAGTASQVGDAAGLRVNFPHVVRAGARWTPPGERLLVEFNAVYEAWHTTPAIDIPVDGIAIALQGEPKPRPVADIHLRKDYHDAFSLRLGGDYQVLPGRLTARAGYFFETQAIPSRTVGVDFPNFLTHAPSLGASLQAFGASIDVGYSYHFMPTQVVDDGVVTALPVPPNPNPQGAVVNNGRYASGQHLLALGVRVPFGALQRAF